MELSWSAIEEFVSTHETFTSSELRDVAHEHGVDVICRMRAKGWKVEVVGAAPRKRSWGPVPKLYHVEVVKQAPESITSVNTIAEGMSCG